MHYISYNSRIQPKSVNRIQEKSDSSNDQKLQNIFFTIYELYYFSGAVIIATIKKKEKNEVREQ